MAECLISCGANIPGPFGKPSQTLINVFDAMQLESLIILKKSKLYSSVAFPNPEKPSYVNGCVAIEVDCDARAVLDILKNIEIKMGRQPNLRWDSRVCDLDLLSFGNMVMPNNEIFEYWYKMPLNRQIIEKPNELLLPHPRIQDRAFVLKPLMDFASDWMHPVLNLTVRQMFNFLSQDERDSVKPIPFLPV